jgi:hypothetical protein
MTAAPNFISRTTKLFKDLGLAFINATVVLIIVASVLIIILLNKVDTFSQDVATNAVNSAIGAVGLNPPQTLQKLDAMSLSLNELNAALNAKKSKPLASDSTGSWSGSSIATQTSSPEEVKIELLTRQLSELNTALDDLIAKKALFTDRAIEKVGKTVSETLTKMRDCASSNNQTGVENSSP